MVELITGGRGGGRRTENWCQSLRNLPNIYNGTIFEDHWVLSEMFDKVSKQLLTYVLQNTCYWKFRNIDRKTPVLESLFNKHLCWSLFLIKLQFLRPATFLKRDTNKAGLSPSKKNCFICFNESFLKTYDVTTWLTNNCNIHIAQYLTK